MSVHARRLGFWLGSHAPKFLVNLYAKRAKFDFVCPICGWEDRDHLTGIRKYCQCGNYMDLKS